MVSSSSSSSTRQPQVGDIVGAYLPHFPNVGQPGPDLRFALVLGLEVDAANEKIEGLWLCRLSERLEKIRNWDCILFKDEILDGKQSINAQDYVLRTPRIDLLPSGPEYFGPEMTIHARVAASFWSPFLGKLEHGQNSHFNHTTYGPREKLPHTFVSHALGSDKVMNEFDYTALITQVMEEKRVERKPVVESRFEKEFRLALSEQRSQMQELRRKIHDDFMMASYGPQIFASRDPSLTLSP